MKKRILQRIFTLFAISMYSIVLFGSNVSADYDGEQLKNAILSMADTSNSLKGKIVDGRSLNSARALLGYLTGLCSIDDETKKPEETNENKPEKFPKDMQLDNYVYEYNNQLLIQVLDNDKLYEVLDKLEQELGIGNIKVVEYRETDVFELELPVLVTREITEKIYNDENVTYAAPPILRLFKE